MTDKYRVHEIVRFNYSDIGEYIDENHTDRPLRNDILVKLLNELYEENQELKKENQGIQNKVVRLLDFVKVKQCVTRTEIKKWWNDD